MIKEADVLNFETYPTFGIVATIQFAKTTLPKLGDLIEYEKEIFKIIGIVISASSSLLYDHFKDNIYDCKLEKVIK